MRYVASIVVVFALAACGGSSSTTLHGNFTDDADVSGNSTPCADQESSAAITVAVDNVPAGSATIN